MISHFVILLIFLFKQTEPSSCGTGSSGSNCDECGITFQQTNVRIVGGTEAVPNSWPSLALIFFNYTFDFDYMGKSNKKTVSSTCGGTLIDRSRIITAAHCFVKDASFSFNGTNIPITVRPNIYHPTYTSMYTVYFGLHNLSSVLNGPSNIFPAVAVSIKKFEMHPNFDSNYLLNDIAIIELVNGMILNERIQTACLPEPSFDLKTNIPAWVAGWGSLKSGGSPSSTLQNVKLTIYNASYCHKIYFEKNWTSQICAGEYTGGKDTCQGDSGGPLMIKQLVNGVERSVLVGIISYGFSCAAPKYPAIYTRVSAFLDWISSSRASQLDDPTQTTKIPKEIPILPPVNCNKSSCKKCGLRFAKPSFRIYGGVEANPYSWPSMALIVFNYKFNVKLDQQVAEVSKQYTCCGSLIDNQTILTAASCYIRQIKTFESGSELIPVRPNSFYPTIQSMYTVYLGVHDKKSILEGIVQPPAVKLGIKSFRTHPNFNSTTFLNDIGILKLSRPVQFDQYVQPACLPKIPGYPKRFNRPSWAVGWGSGSNDSVMFNRLQNVKLVLYKSNMCNNVYPDVEKNWNRQLCSGFFKGGKDTCDGDSGGPLYLRERVNGEFKYLLAGITSYGDGCGLPEKPGIYTKVSSYLRWIRIFLSGTHNRFSNLGPRKNSKKCGYGKVGKYCDECGKQYFEPNVRIIGGKEARPHSWPSTVLIRFKFTFEYRYRNQTKNSTKTGFCSGNLIDRRTVLTVAHCFYKNFLFDINGVQHLIQVTTNKFHPTFESMYTIYLGLENNIGIYDNQTSIEPGIAVSIEKFIKHENYKDSRFECDIAIIKLMREVELTPYVQPACLPDPRNKNFPNEMNIAVWAVGWGSVSVNGDIPSGLHNVKLTLYNRAKCFGVIRPEEADWTKLLCAGEYLGGKDTCFGDSGGPLFVRSKVNEANKYVLAGLTSFGIGCGLARFPGIYTKISSFLPWIESYAEKKN